MNARTPKTSLRTEAASSDGSLNFLADLARQQMSVASDASCAMLRGFDAMRKIHEQAAHDTSARHQVVAQKLHGTVQPFDLMTLQTGLLRNDLESATQYWQQLAATALEMQTEMIGCASHLVDAETALETAAALEPFDMLPGVSSLFALQPGAASPQARKS
jgi:hypothetical protein